MGKVVISHIAALQQLLHSRNYRSSCDIPSGASLSGAICPGNDDAKLLKSLGYCEGKLDYLVFDRSQLRRTKTVRGHLWSGPLPRGSLIPVDCRLGEIDLYVCSPELVFYQIATMLNEREAIYFGMTLCSDFRLEPAATGGVVYRQNGDGPLTTPARLASFLDRLSGRVNCKKALQALKHVVPHARSPKECALGMLFSLPSRLGGFDLGGLVFNPSFEMYMGTDVFGHDRKGKRIPDIALEHVDHGGVKRVVLVDYDPAVTHSGAQKENQDTRRRNDLATVKGVAHFSITSDDAGDFTYLRTTAERMRRVLRRPKRPCLRCPPESAEGRRKLEMADAERRSLWKQFVIKGFDRVIDELPLERERGKTKCSTTFGGMQG